MYCIVSYCVLRLYLICYLYTNVSTKVTRNKDIYGDKHGNCTCKNASVVDYCICNGSFVNRFFTILNVLEFSKLFSDVHCPLSIYVNVKQYVLSIQLRVAKRVEKR